TRRFRAERVEGFAAAPGRWRRGSGARSSSSRRVRVLAGPADATTPMSRTRARLRPLGERGRTSRTDRRRRPMAKYLLLKHYRGAPAATNDVPMEQWTPEEWDAHVRYMDDFADQLQASGEYVDSQALSPEGTFVRFDGEGKPPVTDGPFAETKDLIAGWMVIDVDSYDRALEVAGQLSAAPGAGSQPVGEWLELRPFLNQTPDTTA